MLQCHQVLVLWRVLTDGLAGDLRRARGEEAAKKERSGRKKNLGLLSFGEEAEVDEDAEEEPSAPRKKIVSAHDVLEDARCDTLPLRHIGP